MRKKLLLLTAALLCSAGSPTILDVYTPSTFEAVYVHPEVSSKNGPVRGIECCVRYKLERQLSIENTGVSVADIAGLYSNGMLTITINGIVIHDIQFSSQAPGFQLAPYDGVTDFGGPSGEVRGFPNQGGFVSMVSDDPALLAAVVDQGPLEIKLVGIDMLGTQGPGNYLAEGRSFITVKGVVEVW